MCPGATAAGHAAGGDRARVLARHPEGAEGADAAVAHGEQPCMVAAGPRRRRAALADDQAGTSCTVGLRGYDIAVMQRQEFEQGYSSDRVLLDVPMVGTFRQQDPDLEMLPGEQVLSLTSRSTPSIWWRS